MLEVKIPQSDIYDSWTRIYQLLIRDQPKTKQLAEDILALEQFLAATLK